jgi:hypothetical protein
VCCCSCGRCQLRTCAPVLRQLAIAAAALMDVPGILAIMRGCRCRSEGIGRGDHHSTQRQATHESVGAFQYVQLRMFCLWHTYLCQPARQRQAQPARLRAAPAPTCYEDTWLPLMWLVQHNKYTFRRTIVEYSRLVMESSCCDHERLVMQDNSGRIGMQA